MQSADLSMYTHVEFRSDAFPAYPGEEDRINPGRYGKRLAEYLAVSLRHQGFAPEPLVAEDWGWVIPITNKEFRLWVGCGNYEEYSDGFLCFIEPRTPFVRRWFTKVETRPRMQALQSALDHALKSHPAVRLIHWWTYEEFMSAGLTPNQVIDPRPQSRVT